MSQKLIGKKKGMTQIFDEKGNLVVCTVIEIEPNQVTQIKTKAHDGYNAIQTASIKRRKNAPGTKPMIGHFAKAGVEPCRIVVESRVENVDEYTLGQAITVEQFQTGDLVDVSGVSKGKGYQGVMKKYGFAGGPAAHGSGFHRHAGSTGMRSTPGRCFKGGPRPSHMGSENITQQNLEVVLVDADKNLCLVRGSVPGSRDGIVYIAHAKKIKQKARSA